VACDGVRRVHRGLRGTPRSCPHQLLDADPLTSGTGTLHPEPYTLHPLPYTRGGVSNSTALWGGGGTWLERHRLLDHASCIVKCTPRL
jgi:hypothetical protein